MNDVLKRMSIDKIVRYFYAGYLFLIVLIIFNKSETLPIIKELGAVNTAICCFSIGAFFYIVYRYVIGEIFLYWLVYIIHWMIELISKEKLNVISFMKKYNVPVLKSRIFYNYLRRSFFNNEDRKKLDYAHSEIHMMYLTSLILFVVYFYFYCFLILANGSSFYVLLGGVIILLSGIIIDIQQHRIEIRKLKYEFDDGKVIECLKKIGVKNPQPKQKI